VYNQSLVFNLGLSSTQITNCVDGCKYVYNQSLVSSLGLSSAEIRNCCVEGRRYIQSLVLNLGLSSAEIHFWIISPPTTGLQQTLCSNVRFEHRERD
jgi:hypothetical protein